MSIYAAVEPLIVSALVLVSALIVLNAFVPGLVRRMRLCVAGWLGHAAKEGPPDSFATKVGNEGTSGDCATDCQSGCNGCAIAARARLSQSDHNGANHAR